MAITAKIIPVICKDESVSEKKIRPRMTDNTKLKVVVTGNNTFVSTCFSAYICSEVLTAKPRPQTAANQNTPESKPDKELLNTTIENKEANINIQNNVAVLLCSFTAGSLYRAVEIPNNTTAVMEKKNQESMLEVYQMVLTPLWAP